MRLQAAGALTGRVKPVTLELGGKSPLIICEDADIGNAVSGAMIANFFTQGEVRCNEKACQSSAILLGLLQRHARLRASQHYEAVYGEAGAENEGNANWYAILLAAYSLSPRSGDPLKEETRVGATITEEHMKKVLAYVEGAKKEGAIIACGGERVKVSDSGCENGFYLSPCVVANCTDDMTVCREEIFGR